MDITLGYGINLIPFGVDEEQTISILGEPDKRYFTDGNNKRLQYNDLLMELSFELANDNRLGWIEVHNPEIVLFGHKLIGKTSDEVLAIMNSKLNEQPVIDDYNSFVSVNYENKWLELQFQFNRLTNINFGVLFGENDEPLWPVSNTSKLARSHYTRLQRMSP